MTKPYHLTQEQAGELWMETPAGETLESSLQAFANAVLDEVLGEPVAYEYFDEKAEYHLTNEEPPEYVTVLNLTPLYAPRREK